MAGGADVCTPPAVTGYGILASSGPLPLSVSTSMAGAPAAAARGEVLDSAVLQCPLTVFGGGSGSSGAGLPPALPTTAVWARGSGSTRLASASAGDNRRRGTGFGKAAALPARRVRGWRRERRAWSAASDTNPRRLLLRRLDRRLVDRKGRRGCDPCPFSEVAATVVPQACPKLQQPRQGCQAESESRRRDSNLRSPFPQALPEVGQAGCRKSRGWDPSSVRSGAAS